MPVEIFYIDFLVFESEYLVLEYDESIAFLVSKQIRYRSENKIKKGNSFYTDIHE